MNHLLNETERINFPAKLFGINFVLKLEPYIFDMGRRLSPDYQGGYWHMYRLDDGGFYMSPKGESFHVVCPNGYDGTMSGDALGIVVCLYAYSELSFGGNPFADICAGQFHLLRGYAFEHLEVGTILAAID